MLTGEKSPSDCNMITFTKLKVSSTHIKYTCFHMNAYRYNKTI